MIVITVARKPLDGTVASNSMKWGCGGVNIDASRIGSPMEDLSRVNHVGDNGWKNSSGGPNNAALRASEGLPPQGRWPANLILFHMPGCHLIGYVSGLKSVETGKLVSEGPQLTHGKGLGGRSTAKVPETVESWECADECPVAGLNEQTGDLPGATSFSRPAKDNATSYTVGNAPLQPGYNDSGGASRFFKVISS